MIEEQARVIAVSDDLAEVVTTRHTACGSCAAKSGCGTSLLAAWFPQRQLTFRLQNRLDARVGDTVIVGLNEGMLQRSSLLLYGLPLIGLLAGAIVGEQLAVALLRPSELGGVLGGLSGLTAALWIVRRESERRVRSGKPAVRLLRVAKQAVSVPLPDARLPAVDVPNRIRKGE